MLIVNVKEVRCAHLMLFIYERIFKMAKKTGTRKIGRSAITGKFVKKSHVKKHPRTTVTETIKKSSRGKKK